jgi:hypothetical protein
MFQLILIALGAIGSAVLAILKMNGTIETGWFLWVSVPFIVGLVLAIVPSIADEGFDLFD